ncbi:hypothetical protein [Paraclostridium bifermentans]
MENLSRADTYEVSKEVLQNDNNIYRINTSINIDICNNFINKKSKGVDY